MSPSSTRAIAGSASGEARPWGRRLTEALAFVAIWMGIGGALRMDANVYLVLGVPLALLFQRYVAKAPLRAAWVREAPPVRLDGTTLGVALVAAIAPAYSLLMAARDGAWPALAWSVAGVGGASGVGYAVRNVDRARVPRLALATGAAAAPGVGLFVLSALALHLVKHEPWPEAGHAARIFGVSFSQYVPICFALEEVAFRGVLDAHVARPQDGKRRRLVAALVLSAAWGLWHLPVVSLPGASPGGLARVALSLICVHTIIGLGMTLAWRWSGTLLVSATAHALADAARNALVSSAT